MSSDSAGMRTWKCPECGRELQLSMTQLDPIACETCLARMKGKKGSKSSATGSPDAAAGPLGMWQSLPETFKLAAVAGAFVVGMLIGFIAGQALSPRSVSSSSESTHNKEVVAEDEPEDRPPAPGPGYKWVRGRTRKDGTRGSGHWAKDPFYKGDDDSKEKKSSK